MTEKIFVENPDMRPTTLVSKLEEAFQSEVLIVPWFKSQDICGHTDGMVRHIKGRELIMDNYELFEFWSQVR